MNTIIYEISLARHNYERTFIVEFLSPFYNCRCQDYDFAAFVCKWFCFGKNNNSGKLLLNFISFMTLNNMQNFDGYVVRNDCQRLKKRDIHQNKTLNKRTNEQTQPTTNFESNGTFDLFSLEFSMITRHSEQVENLW